MTDRRYTADELSALFVRYEDDPNEPEWEEVEAALRQSVKQARVLEKLKAELAAERASEMAREDRDDWSKGCAHGFGSSARRLERILAEEGLS